MVVAVLLFYSSCCSSSSACLQYSALSHSVATHFPLQNSSVSVSPRPQLLVLLLTLPNHQPLGTLVRDLNPWRRTVRKLQRVAAALDAIVTLTLPKLRILWSQFTAPATVVISETATARILLPASVPSVPLLVAENVYSHSVALVTHALEPPSKRTAAQTCCWVQCSVVKKETRLSNRNRGRPWDAVPGAVTSARETGVVVAARNVKVETQIVAVERRTATLSRGRYAVRARGVGLATQCFQRSAVFLCLLMLNVSATAGALLLLQHCRQQHALLGLQSCSRSNLQGPLPPCLKQSHLWGRVHETQPRNGGGEICVTKHDEKTTGAAAIRKQKNPMLVRSCAAAIRKKKNPILVRSCIRVASNTGCSNNSRHGEKSASVNSPKRSDKYTCSSTQLGQISTEDASKLHLPLTLRKHRGGGNNVSSRTLLSTSNKSNRDASSDESSSSSRSNSTTISDSSSGTHSSSSGSSSHRSGSSSTRSIRSNSSYRCSGSNPSSSNSSVKRMPVAAEMQQCTTADSRTVGSCLLLRPSGLPATAGTEVPPTIQMAATITKRSLAGKPSASAAGVAVKCVAEIGLGETTRYYCRKSSTSFACILNRNLRCTTSVCSNRWVAQRGCMHGEIAHASRAPSMQNSSCCSVGGPRTLRWRPPRRAAHDCQRRSSRCRTSGPVCKSLSACGGSRQHDNRSISHITCCSGSSTGVSSSKKCSNWTCNRRVWSGRSSICCHSPGGNGYSQCKYSRRRAINRSLCYNTFHSVSKKSLLRENSKCPLIGNCAPSGLPIVGVSSNNSSRPQRKVVLYLVSCSSCSRSSGYSKESYKGFSSTFRSRMHVTINAPCPEKCWKRRSCSCHSINVWCRDAHSNYGPAATETADPGDVALLAAAPMMDYTDCHWRKLVSLVSSRVVLYSEMVSLPAVVSNSEKPCTSLFVPDSRLYASFSSGCASFFPGGVGPLDESGPCSFQSHADLLQKTKAQRVLLPPRCCQQLRREMHSRYDVVNPVVIQLGTGSPAAAASAVEQLLQCSLGTSVWSRERSATGGRSNSSRSVDIGTGISSSGTVLKDMEKSKEKQHLKRSLHVNLNCGCPSPRVASGGFGLTLMQKPAVVAAICNALYAAYYHSVGTGVSSSSDNRHNSFERYCKHSSRTDYSSGSGCTWLRSQAGDCRISRACVRASLSSKAHVCACEGKALHTKRNFSANGRTCAPTSAGGFGGEFTVSVKCRVGLIADEGGLQDAFGSCPRISYKMTSRDTTRSASSNITETKDSTRSRSRVNSSGESLAKECSGSEASNGEGRLEASTSCRRSGYLFLANFIHHVASHSPVRHFVVHARPGIIDEKEASVSPSCARWHRRAAAFQPPALLINYVYQLCRDFPSLHFTLNGGVTSMHEAMQHLQRCPLLAGVMVGRGFIEGPWYWAANADRFFHAVSHRNRDTGSICSTSGYCLPAHPGSTYSREISFLRKGRWEWKRIRTAAPCQPSLLARGNIATSTGSGSNGRDHIPLVCKSRRELLAAYSRYADSALDEIAHSQCHSGDSHVEQAGYAAATVGNKAAARSKAAAVASEAAAILKPLWNLFSGEPGGKTFRRLLQLQCAVLRQELMQQQQQRRKVPCQSAQASSDETITNARHNFSERSTEEGLSGRKPVSLGTLIWQAAQAIPAYVLDGTLEETDLQWNT